MAGVGRSIKPSLLSPRLARPAHPRRTLSSSSEMSSAASSPRSEDPFVFSVGHTPANEEPPAAIPSHNITPTTATAVTKGKQTAPQDLEDHQPSHKAQPFSHDRADLSTLHRSRPIAIQLPVRRKPSTGSVYTPPEPLSARGDVAGGYFPLHENPMSRVHRPHPFHPDVTKARHHSISQAAGYVSLQQTQRDFGSPTNVSEPLHSIKASPLGRLNDNIAFTPMASYIPRGVHENALPTGKYYPSNYESRTRTQHSRPSSTSASTSLSATAGTLKPDSAASKCRRPSHCRNDSDATRRLQQYQRDMVAQATRAASQVLGSAGQATGAKVAATASLHGAPVQPLQLGGANLNRAKPSAPKLAPIGSPGPVTPMELDGADGYLALSRTAAASEPVRDDEEVARAIRADKHKRRVDGGSSPSVNGGPA